MMTIWHEHKFSSQFFGTVCFLSSLRDLRNALHLFCHPSTFFCSCVFRDYLDYWASDKIQRKMLAFYMAVESEKLWVLRKMSALHCISSVTVDDKDVYINWYDFDRVLVVTPFYISAVHSYLADCWQAARLTPFLLQKFWIFFISTRSHKAFRKPDAPHHDFGDWRVGVKYIELKFEMKSG